MKTSHMELCAPLYYPLLVDAVVSGLREVTGFYFVQQCSPVNELSGVDYERFRYQTIDK